jgi:hypothetical protein
MTSETSSNIGSQAKPFWYSPLALTLRPFQVATLRRWLSILALGVVGSIVAMILSASLGSTTRRLGELAATLPMPLFASALVVLASIVYAPLVRLGALRWGHWRSVLVYPPVWVAAIIGALGTLCLKRTYRGLPLPDADPASVAWSVSIWVASPLLCLAMWTIFSSKGPTRKRMAARDEPSPEYSVEQALQELANDPAGRLIPWLEVERPVSDPYQDDLFRMRITARRIAEHFFEDRLGTVGLIGSYGAGKSSIVRFVEYYLEEDQAFRKEIAERWKARDSNRNFARYFPPRVILCKVSVWGMVDRSGAAAVLRHAVERLAEEADCLSVITLPDRYVQAFKGAGSSWMNLPLMLSSADDATEQLRGLAPILRALNARLVVVIEDIDRNADGSEGAVDGRVARDLQAMLAHLREVDNVSFMLNVSTSGTIDFSRLCERIEWVRPIESRLVWPVVSALRASCLDVARERGDLLTAHDDSLRQFEPEQEFRWVFFGKSNPPVALALSKVMGNPRTLKQALRHTWLAWQRLHGEVDLDDLLICNVIRARSPDAFDFLIGFYGSLGHDSIEDDRRKEITEAWTERVRDCSQSDRDLLWSLVVYLFPPVGTLPVFRTPRLQGVHEQIYWERVVSGYVSEPIRDQAVLGDVALWKQGDAGSTLARALASDSVFAATFERLNERRLRDEFRLTRDELCRLASQVLEMGLQIHRADAAESTLPGFITLWGRVSQHQRTDVYWTWLWEEIQKALPQSMALGNDLEYAWGSSSPPNQLPSLDEAIELRMQMIAWSRQHFSGGLLARSLGRTELYALYHFVRHTHIDYGPAFEAQHWRWLVPILIHAMEIASDVVTPQVCLFVSRPSRHVMSYGEGRPKQVVSHGLDLELIESLVPDNGLRQRLMELLAESPLPSAGRDPSAVKAVDAIRAEARHRIQEFAPGSPSRDHAPLALPVIGQNPSGGVTDANGDGLGDPAEEPKPTDGSTIE